jgi:uncharacterized protein (TIGR02266 family)
MSKAMQSATANLPGNEARSGHDHRTRESRRQYDIQVGVTSDHRLFVGLSANISAGGLFIATDEHLKKGDKLDVKFSIPGSDHVFQKRATVCWTRPFGDDGERNRAGAGVKLEELSDDETRILNAFLKVSDPIFFDL